MGTSKAAALSLIMNDDGTISRQKMREILFPDVDVEDLTGSVGFYAFKRAQAEWDKSMQSLLPDDSDPYYGWDYNPRVTVRTHIEKFIDHVLRRMGINPALTYNTPEAEREKEKRVPHAS